MKSHQTSLLLRGLIAGLAGGLAEILWVSLYSAAAGENAAEVARGVTTAAGLNGLLQGAPITVGVTTHLLLAMVLGIALAFSWRLIARRTNSRAACYLFVMAALAGVWVMNFFLILPIVSPAFVAMLPYSVSLTSKLLFGLAAAETLRRTSARQAGITA